MSIQLQITCPEPTRTLVPRLQVVRTTRARKSGGEEQVSPRQQFPQTRISSLRSRRRGRGAIAVARRNCGSPALIFRSDVWWVDGRRRRRPSARDEIAPPPGGTRCRDDELSPEKYANPIGPDPRGPSSASRKAVYRNEYFSIPRPRLDSRTRRFPHAVLRAPRSSSIIRSR